MTPSGIDQATFWFIAQYLNHSATAVPTNTIEITQKTNLKNITSLARKQHADNNWNFVNVIAEDFFFSINENENHSGYTGIPWDTRVPRRTV
jgi:hypothetical protein